MVKKNEMAKPFLKWAGGKRQLLPQLIANMPSEQIYKHRYYEPFVGAGALLFDRQPTRVTINDANSDLILTYKSIRDTPETLISLLSDYESNNNNSDDFYRIRDYDRNEKYKTWTDVEKAARLIYLNKTCYNGLYRVNSQGFFNTPFGGYKNPAICDIPVIRAVSMYLLGLGKNLTIENVDFEESSVKNAKKGDFVYFDPPYYSSEKTNFTGYQSGGFDQDDQRRLAELFANLSDRHVNCMLSNSSDPFILKLYENYNIKDHIRATRTINCEVDGRGCVDEVIVTNY